MNLAKHSAKVGLLFALVLGMMTAASARFFDPTIAIERAINSPVITVKYTELRATLVEVRLNGKSVATRTVNADRDNGTLQFHIDLTGLEEGDNTLEVRMFGEDGELLGTQSETIKLDTGADLPVEIASPESGATLRGTVEIKVGMSKTFTKPFVSFMINGDWKAIRNVEPFTYQWDTELVANGWHEIQVWLVDEKNVTYRSKRIRVFVNNAGGRTNRNLPSIPTTPVVPTVKPMLPPVAPLAAVAGDVVGRMAPASGVAKIKLAGQPVTTGVRSLTPTGTRVVTPKATPKVAPKVAPKVTKPVAPKTLPKVINTTNSISSKLVTIKTGTRLPNVGHLKVTYNAAVINFDVAPRVVEGVPVTPFRHLFEHAGGQLKWSHEAKEVFATGLGNDIFLKIGSKDAKVGSRLLTMEREASLIGNRTVVPFSFLRDSLGVEVDYDPKSGHVLIRKAK